MPLMTRVKRPTLYGPNGKPLPRPRAPAPQSFADAQAGFDAAKTTDYNKRHWANADALSADAVASPSVRKKLRNRARYEVANNSYAKGIVLTLANYCVSTGPTLQILDDDKDATGEVEYEFLSWCKAINLAAKLRTLRMARAQDGEAFAMLTYNPSVPHPVKLDVAIVECDRVSDNHSTIDAKNADGIQFDGFGNPVTYRVLRSHPGDALFATPMAADIVPASSMIHTFRQDRPGQRRGIPEITPALPLYALLRRYTLATTLAAESAANMAGWLYTDQLAEQETAIEAEPFEAVNLEPNMFTVAPYGYKALQMKAEQPTTVYSDFKREIVNEIARCLNMPYNIAACNSSDYNYASGRLDYQVFYAGLMVDRHDLSINGCDRILDAWKREASNVWAYLPELSRLGPSFRYRWMWPGFPKADPLKEAHAFKILHECGGDTLANNYGLDGRDWEPELRQWAVEKALIQQAAPAPQPNPQPKEES